MLSLTLIVASLWAGLTVQSNRTAIARHVELVGRLLAAQQALGELDQEPSSSTMRMHAVEALERALEQDAFPAASAERRAARERLLAMLQTTEAGGGPSSWRSSMQEVRFDLGTEATEQRALSSARAGALRNSWTAIEVVLVVGSAAALLCTVLLELGRRRAESQRRTLEALEESERRLASVVSTAPILLSEIDRNGIITMVRGQVLELLGLRLEDVLGRSVFELYSGHPELPEIYRRALAGERITTQVELRGTHLLCLKAPRLDAAGNVLGLISISTDISELVRAREALRMSEEARLHGEKLAAVGRMSSVVAHEFANLLTIIRGMTELLQIELGPAHDSQRELAGIQQASQRATRLSQELLDFSRPQPSEPRVLDLGGLVARVRPWLAAMLRPSTRIELALDERALPVKVDPGRIEQVLLNLARNAEDAMPAGGTLTLRTTFVLNGGLPAALLTVHDTGHGMPSEVRAKIFEPFFTTKEHGTGLGLSVTHGIVTQAGGTITVASEPGQGTTFELQFPLQAESAHELRPQDPRPQRHQDSAMLDLLQRR
ncbi:MAG: ATP-binding protein [Planctomycetota bacterium]